MARTLTIRNVPDALAQTVIDLAIIEDRTTDAQATRLIREALSARGHWPPSNDMAENRTAGQPAPAGTYID